MCRPPPEGNAKEQPLPEAILIMTAVGRIAEVAHPLQGQPYRRRWRKSISTAEDAGGRRPGGPQSWGREQSQAWKCSSLHPGRR